MIIYLSRSLFLPLYFIFIFVFALDIMNSLFYGSLSLLLLCKINCLI